MTIMPVSVTNGSGEELKNIAEHYRRIFSRSEYLAESRLGFLDFVNTVV